MKIIVGCFYKHSNTNDNDFKDHCLNELLCRVSKKNSTIFFPSNFNINLLNYDTKYQEAAQNLIKKVLFLIIFQLSVIKY